MLRQLSTSASGLEAVVLNARGELPAVPWIDASDADDAELGAAARTLGLSDAVACWLADPGRSARPRVIDDAVAFVLAVPAVDHAPSVADDDALIAVAITSNRACTAHSAAADHVLANAARRVAKGPVHDHALAAVLSLVDQVVDRYDEIVEALGASQEAHAAEIANTDRRSTPSDVVSEGLRLANRIGDVQRRVRGLRHAMVALRPFSARADDSTEAAFDSSWRAIDALDADVDALNHRLEAMTDAQLSLLSARQAEVNKAIGAWAGVFAVNAVITGWYGMNISGLPGSGSWVTVAILMAGVTVALIVLFRRVDWL